MENFDLVVIGAGIGGYVTAIRASQLGLKVACVEKSPALGGTCLNVGCIPSKALLESSEQYVKVKHKLDKHGIKVSGVELDLSKMIGRKNEIVKAQNSGVQFLLKKNKIEHVAGTAQFEAVQGGQKVVTVLGADGKTRTLSSAKVVIATGSEPSALPFLPFDGKKVVSSTEALDFTSVPEKLVVIGGGVIGVEMASVWSRLGSKVTVVEFLDRLIPGFDLQLATELQKILTKQGIEFKLGTKCLGAKPNGTGLTIEAEEIKSQTKLSLEANVVLVATGRRAYTQNLGLDKIGITPDKQGRIPVDGHYQTSIPGVYAVGDVIAGPMLAHKAEEEGVAVAEIIAGRAGHVNYEAIPGVIYTHPEVATVGASEEDLKAKGIAYKTGSYPFKPNGRARAMEEGDGFAKILADAKTDRILGAHIVGPHAGDLLAEVVAIMEFRGSAEDLARTCHAHPTLSEVVKEAALGVDKRAIHG